LPIVGGQSMSFVRENSSRVSKTAASGNMAIPSFSSGLSMVPTNKIKTMNKPTIPQR
jgi:hypothetical protein